MRQWFSLFFTILCCLTVLIIDIWPGLLMTLWYVLTLGGLLCGLGIFMGPFIYLIWRLGTTKQPAKSPEKLPRRFVKIRWVIIGLTFLLWLVDVPRRIVFSLYVNEFEKWLVNVPKGYGGKKLGKYIGPYFVDSYGSYPDSGEGVYFLVNQHGFGIGPDTISYGFVYKPNREGTPFGFFGAYDRLFGDWYWFRTSTGS